MRTWHILVHRSFCMLVVSGKLYLDLEEFVRGELHVQGGLFRAQWRPVCGVHARKIQGSYRSWSMQLLSVKLQLACWEFIL
jgi:hypothetical protein